MDCHVIPLLMLRDARMVGRRKPHCGVGRLREWPLRAANDTSPAMEAGPGRCGVA